ncbi:MAG TPA: AmmeMemoRadiSam system radical SAM enzyme [Geothermobacteraceae bacterium]|nr:AmmeMemoRadiSam system radical SAM enzyme [Geothermobacteraceae bacterium]
MHKAMFQEAIGGERVRCGLCRFCCSIAAGQRGLCGVRENRDGVLYSLVYGKAVAENVDPIEKKPLFHVYPGSLSYSVATVGCNFRCLHCQNHQISQWPHEQQNIAGAEVTPRQLVERALAAACRSIAYTYTEPTIYFEYAFETAKLARQAGLANVFVSNGYITSAALETIAPYLDAANIDLKGFSDDFYREITGASLQGVLDCLRDYRRLGIWLEVTTLLIPGRNDDPEELRALTRFIAEQLGPETPWHVTGFYPTYKLQDAPPTSLASLQTARKIGHQAGLKFVYTGNRGDADSESTRCPACRKLVIERSGFQLVTNHLQQGQCPWCDYLVEGCFSNSSQ